MAKPKLALIPAAQGDKFYSVLPSDGVGDFDFTRNSSATRIAPTGFIEEVGAFGSELVTNGNFDNNSDWSLGSGWSISGGLAVGTSASGNLQQNIGAVAGKKYKLTFNVTAYTSGSLSVDLGGASAQTTSSVGLKTFNFTATSTGNLRFYGGSFSGSIDNVSVVEVVGNKSRLDYDLLNGKVVNCPHYLLEPASTNIIPYSEDLTQATIWTPTRCNITANQITSPDGALNADLLTVTDGSIENYVQTSALTVSGTKQTASFFVKKGTSDFCHILLWDTSNDGARQWFDLNNGIVGTSTTFGSGVSVDSAQIINYGNDWFRCIAVFNNSNTTVRFRMSASNSNGGTTSTIGKTIYIWGAQLEVSSYPTSYIPTNGTAITRAAETANGSGDAATFNDSEGVLMAEIAALADDSSLRTITIGDNSSANAVSIRVDNANQIVAYVNSGGSNQCSFTSSVPTSLFNKCLIKYKANDFSAWVNGFKIGVDTSGIIFPSGTLNRLNFDIGYSSTSAFYGKTREVQYFDSVLTDAQLETLTSWTSLQEMITSQLYTNY